MSRCVEIDFETWARDVRRRVRQRFLDEAMAVLGRNIATGAALCAAFDLGRRGRTVTEPTAEELSRVADYLCATSDDGLDWRHVAWAAIEAGLDPNRIGVAS